ncbi:hypothetical protein GCM10028801_44890 [Nocardioides maradonensis]
MSALTPAALQVLADAGLSEAAWIEWCEGPGATEWRGDACGCSDDRCRDGYHHERDEECGCLPALIAERARSYAAAAELAPIWQAYRAALEANDGAGDPDAYEAAWAAAEAWVRTYDPNTISFSLDALVNGRAGLSTRNRYNDDDHLIWQPGMDRLVRWADEVDPVDA